MIAGGGLLPVVMLLLVAFVMPESPRWLVQKGRSEEAKRVIQSLHGEAGEGREAADDWIRGLESSLRATSGSLSLSFSVCLCLDVSLSPLSVV